MDIQFLLTEKSRSKEYHITAMAKLRQVIEHYQGQGERVVGYTIDPRWDDDDRRVDFTMQDLQSGEQHLYLSTAREAAGQQATSDTHVVCDYYQYGDGCQWMIDRFHQQLEDADTLVFAKLGKWEIAGGGFAPLLKELLQSRRHRRLLLMCRKQYLKGLLASLGLNEDEIRCTHVTAS